MCSEDSSNDLRQKNPQQAHNTSHITELQNLRAQRGCKWDWAASARCQHPTHTHLSVLAQPLDLIFQGHELTTSRGCAAQALHGCAPGSSPCELEKDATR